MTRTRRNLWMASGLLPLALTIALSAQAVPDRRDVPQKLFATGLYNLKTNAGQAAFVDAVVATLHGQDERWGHLRKNPGQTQLHTHAGDAALYLSDVAGQSTAVDFIGGAGGPNPQPGWGVDQPRYSTSDWLDPFEHVAGIRPTRSMRGVTEPYAGDAVFDALGVVLFSDYAAAGQAPTPKMGRWFGRTIHDWIAGNTKTLDESIAKHRAEWRTALKQVRKID
jgi:hypothetical protein